MVEEQQSRKWNIKTDKISTNSKYEQFKLGKRKD